jgi:hypothetical protein
MNSQHFFFNPMSEALTFGFFPLFGFSLRWKSAEDGITWIRPTFSVIKYR